MRLERRFSLKGLIDIHVIRQADKESIGYLTDISTGGFKITGDDAIAPESEFQVDLMIPVRSGHHRTLSLPVICKWSRRDGRTRRFNVGVQLLESSEAYLELVTEIRGQLKRNRRQPV